MFRQRFAIPCLVIGALVLSRADAASNVVQYTHDASGNIVAIQRVNPAPITLSGFAPASGPAGSPVTLTGTGFGASAAQNTVSFNGVVATVTAASATSLTVTVPAGASTGRIAVTAGGNSIASAQDFVVTSAGAPTIATFTPVSGPAGTVVTVNGTNFTPAAGATTVKLNQTPATVSSVTAANLDFTVPPGTGSGKIRVTTTGGSVVSSADFIVPPGGIPAAEVLAATRLATDGTARGISLYATNKYGLVLFDGAAGAWMSLQIANFTITPASATIAYTIYKPDNAQLASGTLSGANLSIHLPPLPMDGTYSLLLRTGLAQVSLDAKLETNRFVPTDATPLDFARSTGQSTRALLAGVAGEQKALMVAGLVTAPVNTPLDITIALPSGSTFRRTNALGLGTTTALAAFTVTGTYAVTLVPSDGTAQSAFKLALLQGRAIAVDGPPADVALVSPGDAARLTFAGVAGQNLGLGVSGVALNPAQAASTTVAVYKPDGALLAATPCSADGTRCATNLENLPVTGNYTLIVQPANGATGTQRLWLSRDVGGMLVTGTPTTVALSRPGQNARLTFAATAGSLLALQVRGVATSPSGQGLLVVVNDPSKALLVYTHLTGAGQTLVMPALAVTGTYSVFIEPEWAAQGAATATMELLLDPGRALDIDGATQPMAIGAAGGSARFLFSAASGQNLGLGIGNVDLNPRTDATIFIYRPDGTQLTAYGCAASTGSCSANLLNLPASGTYGIVVRPTTGAAGSLSATLSSELLGALTLGGPALAINVDRLGRNARLTFAGTAGQTLRVSWSGAAATAGNTSLTVLTPAGSTMGGTIVSNGGTGTYDVPALPVTGSYTLFVDPQGGATPNATLRIAPR